MNFDQYVTPTLGHLLTILFVLWFASLVAVAYLVANCAWDMGHAAGVIRGREIERDRHDLRVRTVRPVGASHVDLRDFAARLDIDIRNATEPDPEYRDLASGNVHALPTTRRNGHR